jgi:long-chain acyl-CoA synthetase
MSTQMTGTEPAGGGRTYAATPGEIPRGTLVQLFLEAVDQYDKPDAQQWRAADGWRSISHRQLLRDVRALVHALGGLGIGRGEQVGLLSENRPEWALADFAMMCAGVRTVPIYPTLPANQLAYILRHAEAVAVFVSTAEQLAKVLEARAELPALRTVITFDDTASDAPDVVTLRSLIDGVAELGSEEAFRREALSAQPDDVATLIYTSGTTGEPKGVMLTHNNLYSNVQAVSHCVENGPEDTALSFLPLSHVFQRMADYRMFAMGTTIAYVASIDDVAQSLQEVKPTLAVAVPRVYEKLYARILAAGGLRRRLVLWARQVALDWTEAEFSGQPPSAGLRVRHAIADRIVFSKLRGRLGGRMRAFVSGGAPLNPQIQSFFHGAGVLILEGYGLTETSPVTNANTPTEMRIGTVGKPIPGTEIRIADDGEILVRGPQIMKGYFRNEEATREVIDDEGWFHTGDIGTIDGDGYLRITDRKKQLLVTAGGKNVAPQPIENAAKLSRFVAEAVLIGDRRPFTVLLVVPNFDTLRDWARQEGLAAAEPAALVREPRVRARLEEEVAARLSDFARYELPKKVVPLPREFSLERGEITPTLKVKRRVIEQAFREQIAEAYEGTGGGSDG